MTVHKDVNQVKPHKASLFHAKIIIINIFLNVHLSGYLCMTSILLCVIFFLCFSLYALFHECVCMCWEGGVIGGIDRWSALMWTDRSCLIQRKGEGESWHCPALLCLCSIESCIYLVTIFLLKRSSITPLIDVHSVFVLLWFAQIYLSPSPLLSFLFPFFLLIPKSDSDRWRIRLTLQCFPPLLLPPLAVFSCAPSNGQSAKGLPMNFLLQGLIQNYLAA